jgi:hypothetical protein
VLLQHASNTSHNGSNKDFKTNIMVVLHAIVTRRPRLPGSLCVTLDNWSGGGWPQPQPCGVRSCDSCGSNLYVGCGTLVLMVFPALSCCPSSGLQQTLACSARALLATNRRHTASNQVQQAYSIALVCLHVTSAPMHHAFKPNALLC